MESDNSMQTLIIIKLECLRLCQIKPTSEQEILPGIKNTNEERAKIIKKT